MTRAHVSLGRIALLACLGAVSTLAIQYLYQARYTLGPVDDAYIHLRVADNLARGEGPVFNVGDRVEVTSSPLWTLLTAALLRVGLTGEAAVRVLGVVSATGAGGATAILGYLAGGMTAALVAPVLLATLPSFAAWAGSGMETPLGICGLAIATCLALVTETAALSTWMFGLAGALVWVRPEMIALMPSLSGVILWNLPRTERLRAALIGGAAWAVPVLALFLGRHWYFGEWLPNTYYAKVAGGGLDQRLRGLSYVATFFALHALYCGAAAFAATRRNPKVLQLGLVALNVALAVVWAGGDGFCFSRLTLAALPLVCAMAASLLPAFESASFRQAIVAVGALAVVQTGWTFKATGDFSTFTGMPVFAANGVAIAKMMEAMPAGTVATEGIGAIGYVSQRTVLDLVGLADKHIARGRRIPGARIGHDHVDLDYVLGRAPELVLPLGWLRDEPLTDETETSALGEDLGSWASALALVRDPRFRARYQARDYTRDGKHLRVWLRNDVARREAVAMIGPKG
jgi:arabinofuranosyltransferase